MLQLFNTTSDIRYEILALAEASIAARHQMLDTNADMLARMQRQRNPSDDCVQDAVLHVLGTAKAVVTNLSEFWNHQDSIWCTQNALEPLLSEVNRDPSASNGPLTSAAFWLAARLRE